MAELKGSRTHDNLKAALATEAQAKLRYLFFARTAEIEGYGDIARTLRELADLETQHVDGHLDFLRRVGDPLSGRPIGDTEHNIAALIASETNDSTDLYPNMARTARSEGFVDIADWFHTLARAKEAHLEHLEEQRSLLES